MGDFIDRSHRACAAFKDLLVFAARKSLSNAKASRNAFLKRSVCSEITAKFLYKLPLILILYSCHCLMAHWPFLGAIVDEFLKLFKVRKNGARTLVRF